MIESVYKELYNELYNSGYHDDDTCHTKWLIDTYVKKYVQPHNNVIDIGCSRGNALKLLSDLNYKNITGVDISSVAVQKCMDRGFNAVVGDTSSIPFPDNKFTALTCTDVLEHVPEDLISKSIVEFCRVVIHGGLIFLQIAKQHEVNKTFQPIADKHRVKNLHVTCWPLDKWLEEFSTWDLKVMHVHDEPTRFAIVLQNKITPEKVNYFNNRL